MTLVGNSRRLWSAASPCHGSTADSHKLPADDRPTGSAGYGSGAYSKSFHFAIDLCRYDEVFIYGTSY